MARCRQTASHWLSQYWPRFMSPYGVTGAQCVKFKRPKAAITSIKISTQFVKLHYIPYENKLTYVQPVDFNVSFHRSGGWVGMGGYWCITAPGQYLNQYFHVTDEDMTTRVSHVRALADMHNEEMYNVGDLKSCKARCKSAIVWNFKQNW